MSEQDLEALLGSAVHLTGQGIAVLHAAADALGPRVALVNEGFCSMYGRRSEEVIGQPLAVFGIVERQQHITRDLLNHVFDLEPFEAEATARRGDGSEFELDLQMVPVTDAGVLTHWVAFLRDVTDSKQQLSML